MSGLLRIAIASGKGGTGKTSLATSLAVALAETSECVTYVDCDVEEPNGHIFLRPTLTKSRDVLIPVPEVDAARCTLCGACGTACRYSAIVALPKNVVTFPKLCHGCGGCTLAVADCDVDAGDLHLVLSPEVLRRWPFTGGSAAVIDAAGCTGCGLCVEHCRFDALRVGADSSVLSYEVDAISCEGCGVCVDVCPERAVALVPSAHGAWFVSETRHGPMAHARLGIAQENSGKLVSLVGREANAVALSARRELLICDGSPCIGCPVIASIAGARMVRVVTEPTLSGLHDLQRVAELCRQFHVRAGVCINKADINTEVADRIERDARSTGIPVLGRIGYDESVTAAQIQQRSVVELGDGVAARDIRTLWERVVELDVGPVQEGDKLTTVRDDTFDAEANGCSLRGRWMG